MQLIAAPAFAASPFFGQNIAMSGKKDLYCASAGGHVLNRNLSCALNHLSIFRKGWYKEVDIPWYNKISSCNQQANNLIMTNKACNSSYW